MKKFLLFGFIIFACGIAKADFEIERSKEVTIFFSSASSAATSLTTSYILIDKSDIINWPIKDNKIIHITSIYGNIDKAATSSTTVRLGVVNWVDASSGSITWFYGMKTANDLSNGNSFPQVNFPGNGLDTTVISSATVTANGMTPGILSTDITDHSTAYQNDVVMPTINSTNVLPAVGDIIIEIQKFGVAINYTFDIRYYTK